MALEKKVTIADVAREAGVSLATVSRVINQKNSVRNATSQRVLDAIDRLGYEVTVHVEREVAHSGLLLFNIPSIANPFYSDVVRGARASAERHGYQLLIHESHINANTLGNLLSVIRHTRAQGIIIANQVQAPILKNLNSIIPVVQCGEYNESANIPYVSVDDVQASVQVVEYLASINRKKIALLDGPTHYKYSRHRLEGYRQGLERLNIRYNPQFVIHLSDVSYDLAIAAAMQLLNMDNPPDAFFAASDVFAISIVRAAFLAGFRIPEDLAVVGFDNVTISATSVPSITTVNQPKRQLGFTACELLLEQISAPTALTKKVILETELIIRESTKL